MANRKKVTVITIIILVVVFGGIFGWRLFVDIMMGNYLKNMKLPPVVVSTETAKTQNWAPYLNSVGTLVAEQGVNVSPEVSGAVTAINFISGQTVKQGTLLVKLNDSVLQAQLAGSIAAEKLAQINYNRDLRLLSQNAIQKSTVDTDQASLQQQQAAVAQYSAMIAQTQIKAPFTGRLGIRQVNLGQYLSAGTQVTNLQQLDPIFVDYPLPQQNLSQVSIGQAIEVSISSYPNQLFKGKVVAVDAQIGSDTRSIMVRAELSNTDMNHLLLPGMLATVHTILPQQDNVITVPQEALNETLYGDSVFVVKNVNQQPTATRTYITAGEQRGNLVAITQGLSAGDVVVTFGQIKIHGDQAAVAIQNSASS